MKKAQKIFILIAVLLSPVLIFLFLKKFGDNRFDLPVYYADGVPLSRCNATDVPYKFTSTYLKNNMIKLPALFFVPGNDANDYYADVQNVLDKYPAINVYAIVSGEPAKEYKNIFPLSFTQEAFLNFINCHLILGEDHWLSNPIPYKYVLIDKDAIIRGYFNCTEFKEIERLDTELDILLNNMNKKGS